MNRFDGGPSPAVCVRVASRGKRLERARHWPLQLSRGRLRPRHDCCRRGDMLMSTDPWAGHLAISRCGAGHLSASLWRADIGQRAHTASVPGGAEEAYGSQVVHDARRVCASRASAVVSSFGMGSCVAGRLTHYEPATASGRVTPFGTGAAWLHEFWTLVHWWPRLRILRQARSCRVPSRGDHTPERGLHRLLCGFRAFRRADPELRPASHDVG